MESPNCKIPKESECKPAFSTADVDNPCKKHKIKEEAASAVIPVHETIMDMASPEVWIAIGRKVLTEADKEIVSLGELLTDKHMNFAQALIKKHFNDLSGLHCTLTISQLQVPMVSENVLQILHIGGNHWVVASNIGCTTGEVNLYDSIYSEISNATQMLLKKVFGNARVTLPKCSRQS